MIISGGGGGGGGGEWGEVKNACLKCKSFNTPVYVY